MPDRLRIVEVNYHHHAEFSSPQEVIEKHKPSNLVLESLQDRMDITLVKHAACTGSYRERRLQYQFFHGGKGFFHIPAGTHAFIKSRDPDIVLVQGFHFPVQVIHLRRTLGKRCRIILQHQGDLPGGKKQWLQRWADSAVSAYFFRSKGNALPWIQSSIIREEGKVHEVPDATTWFRRLDREACRKIHGIGGDPVFLWVGRFDENKDPLTVLRAFDAYCRKNPLARLYMVSGGGRLQEQVQAAVSASTMLSNSVIMAGHVDHSRMAEYYSAAEYFITASHHEGGSYALTEAMACGCIPVISDIPPSLEATGHGSVGYVFTRGDHQSLAETLSNLGPEKQKESSVEVETHFHRHLSAGAIASRLYGIFSSLVPNTSSTLRTVLSSG